MADMKVTVRFGGETRVNSAAILICFQVLLDDFPNEIWCGFYILLTHGDSPHQGFSIQRIESLFDRVWTVYRKPGTLFK